MNDDDIVVVVDVEDDSDFLDPALWKKGFHLWMEGSTPGLCPFYIFFIPLGISVVLCGVEQPDRPHPALLSVTCLLYVQKSTFTYAETKINVKELLQLLS